MKRLSFIDRVIGKASPEEKNAVLEMLKNRFETEVIQKIVKIEREKTPKEKQIILQINEETNNLRKKFGLEEFDIPEKNVHIIRKDEWATKGEDAISSPEFCFVFIRETDTDIQFAHNVFHEFVHVKSYNAVQFYVDAEEVGPYRHGLRSFSRSEKKVFRNNENSYFRELNEAVTEEYARLFVLHMSQTGNPLYAEDFQETKKLREQALEKGLWKILFDQELYSLFNDPKTGKICPHAFGYELERMSLLLITNDLFQKNREKFSNREEVFDIFGRAMFTGCLFELWHLMEKTFGKGTMRSIGTP